MANQSDSYNPLAVTASILLADGILFALAYFGEDHNIGVGSTGGPVSICPVLDSLVCNNCLKSVAVAVHVLTAGAAMYWHKNQPAKDICNVLLFCQSIIAFGWWTAHTGGLSQSINGPSFLALFPVATIVPRARWVKLVGGGVVAAVALLIAFHTPDRAKELFIWTGSIVGCTLGWIIQQFLDKLITNKDPNGHPK